MISVLCASIPSCQFNWSWTLLNGPGQETQHLLQYFQNITLSGAGLHTKTLKTRYYASDCFRKMQEVSATFICGPPAVDSLPTYENGEVGEALVMEHSVQTRVPLTSSHVA